VKVGIATNITQKTSHSLCILALDDYNQV